MIVTCRVELPVSARGLLMSRASRPGRSDPFSLSEAIGPCRPRPQEPQQYTFQAEIAQLLHLLAHSLYQSREIALRELISNASDALDKMRLRRPDRRRRSATSAEGLEIVVEGRADAARPGHPRQRRRHDPRRAGREPRDDRPERLARVPQGNLSARRGKADLSLIGQFGVGFYSAFMLADHVTVRTRSYREDARATSGDPTAPGPSRSGRSTKADRGTEVILHLKDDAPRPDPATHRIKQVVRTYSRFIPHPIRVGDEVVNDQKPIWVEPKAQVTDEQHAPVLPAPRPPGRRDAALAPAPGRRLADPVPGGPLLPAGRTSSASASAGPSTA